jgi:hypothetical protein
VITAPGTAGYLLFLIGYGFEQFKQLDANAGLALLAQIQFIDQLFITIGFCFAQIIEQTPALRDHLKQAAPRRMIFPIGLKVLSQMLDPAGQKCDLHIRAAGIFFMQLELLETRRLVALCHNEGANLDEDRVLATYALKCPCGGICVIRMPHRFRVCHRTKDSVSHANEPCGVRRRSL